MHVYPVHKKAMSKTADRNYLLVDAGINYQIRCLQIPGRYINVRDYVLVRLLVNRVSTINARFCVGTERILKNESRFKTINSPHSR